MAKRAAKTEPARSPGPPITSAAAAAIVTAADVLELVEARTRKDDRPHIESAASKLRRRRSRLTQREQRALDRRERLAAHLIACQALRHVPRIYVRRMMGNGKPLSTATLNDLAAAYRLPIDGDAVDLAAVFRRLAEILAEQKAAYTAAALPEQAAPETGEKYWQTELARLRVLEKAGELVGVGVVREMLQHVGDALRELREKVRRRHGDDAGDLVDRALGVCESRMREQVDAAAE